MSKAILRNAGLPALLAGGFVLLDLILDGLVGSSARLDWPHAILGAVVLLVSYMLMSRAVDTRRRAEAVLRRARDELEARVQERTAALGRMNEQLQAEIAERHRMAEALRASEETARALMDASTESAVLTDTQGIVLAANETGARSLGTTVERMVGSALFSFFSPEVAERRRSYLSDVLRTHQPAHYEDERAGRLFDINIHPVSDADGNIIRLAAFGRDITERRQAEATLQQANQRLELTQAAAGAGSWDWDTSSGRFEWSEKMFDLFGLDIRTTVASFDAWRAALHPEDRDEAERRIVAALEEHSELVSEYRVILPDGQIRWISALGRGIYDEQDQPTRMNGICLDITDRKRAEEALRASEEKFATAFHLSPDAIGIVREADGAFLDINEAFTTVLGYSRSEVVGRRWTDLGVIPATDERDRITELFREKGHVADHELSLPVKTGGVATVLLSLIAIAVSGEPCILAIAHDVTKRKHSEEALRQVQEELTQRVQERTALEERQRLARELHDSVSQALYGISLGVNTALTLFDTDRTKVLEALQYALELAHDGLTEMRALIFELRPESLRMEGLVTALARQTAAVRARYNIEVGLIMCDEPDVSLAVKEALFRIAQEALQNAARHARSDRLDVRLAREPSALTLEVCDKGVGFDPAAPYPGHLGLHSMRERAMKAGGTLDIISAPDCGTQVRVHIPVPANATTPSA